MELMDSNKFRPREVKSKYCANILNFTEQQESWKYRRKFIDFYAIGYLAGSAFESQ